MGEPAFADSTTPRPCGITEPSIHEQPLAASSPPSSSRPGARQCRRTIQRICVSLGFATATGVLAAAAAAAPPESQEQRAFDAALTEADRLFVEGDLPGALAVLEPVCAASKRAECSFSLGAIYHGLGRCTQALEHYRRYRQQAPSGEHIAEVTSALQEVEGRCGDASAASPERRVGAPGTSTPQALPGGESEVHPVAPPLPVTAPASSTGAQLLVGSLAASGAAAASSVVFGILAARSARRCERARAYDRDFIEECEVAGPRYQALWQGFAVASGGFLGIGLTLWWFDARSSASVGVTDAGFPGLQYQRRF
jgi:hypothetical protein